MTVSASWTYVPILVIKGQAHLRSNIYLGDWITFMKPFELIRLSNCDEKVEYSGVFTFKSPSSKMVNFFSDRNSRHLSQKDLNL